MTRPTATLPLLLLALIALPGGPTFAADRTEVEIGVIPGALKFDTTRFDVPAGGAVRIVFNNNGLMPHNLVVGSKVGSADAIVEAAMAIAANGYDVGFVPDTPLVLKATKLLNVKQEEAIDFTAPKEPGSYPFVCTFPGHGVIMRGEMRVLKAGEKLEPPVRDTAAGAVAIDRLAESNVTPKPMGSIERPLVMRTFVPNLGFDQAVLSHHERGYPSPKYNPSSGKDVNGEYRTLDGIPAAVAVNFGEALSYAWDTTECRLLYAWSDGFMDMTDYWGGGAGGNRKSFGYLADPVGKLVFKTAGAFPMKIGSSAATPVYKGYRLRAGTPVFRYTLGEATVYEAIVPGDGDTVAIQYRIENAGGDVRLAFDPAIRKLIRSDRGQWDGDTLVIPGKDAGQFVVMITKQDLGTMGPKAPEPIMAKDTGKVFAAVGRLADGKDRPAIESGLKPGAKIYQDREYTFGEMPDEVAGADYVRGFNNDSKGRAGYVLKVEKPTVIYLLLDKRQRQTPTTKKTPKLTKLDAAVKTSHDWTFDVYRAEVGPGEYRFAPQSGGSMYVIAAKRK